ncbi:MAG: hypothetical protein HUJ76_12595 [Parasporobacterium sp.]|nr:hypothetical protein [Parasporobacterium sp.]
MKIRKEEIKSISMEHQTWVIREFDKIMGLDDQESYEDGFIPCEDKREGLLKAFREVAFREKAVPNDLSMVVEFDIPDKDVLEILLRYNSRLADLYFSEPVEGDDDYIER